MALWRKGPMKTYPATDTNPAMQPMRRAAHGSITRSAEEPTATPPANVAFWMSTMSNL
jgi:hypothetical protein